MFEAESSVNQQHPGATKFTLPSDTLRYPCERGPVNTHHLPFRHLNPYPSLDTPHHPNTPNGQHLTLNSSPPDILDPQEWMVVIVSGAGAQDARTPNRKLNPLRTSIDDKIRSDFCPKHPGMSFESVLLDLFSRHGPYYACRPPATTPLYDIGRT